MYRIGKSQKRALLTEEGREVVIFSKGQEALAEKVCNLLNGQTKNNLTEEEFCKIVEGYWGEPLSDIKQLVSHTFTGEELYEFCKHLILNNSLPQKDWFLKSILPLE